MEINQFSKRLVKAGRIKSAQELKMLDLFKSQTKKRKKDVYVLEQAKHIFNLLPKAIKSIY